MHTRSTRQRFESAGRVQLRAMLLASLHVFETHRHGTLYSSWSLRVVLIPSRSTASQRLTLIQPRVSFVWAAFEVNEKRPDDFLLTVLLEDR